MSRPVSKNIARAPSLRAPYDGFMEPLSLALKCRVRGAGLFYITKPSKWIVNLYITCSGSLPEEDGTRQLCNLYERDIR